MTTYYRIGSGGDFANFDTGLAALPNPLVDDYHFNQISSTVENGNMAYSGNFAGHTITITCEHNEQNRNDITKWYVVNLNSGNSDGFSIVLTAGSGSGYMSFIYVARVVTIFDGVERYLIQPSSLVLAPDYLTFSVRNCYIKGNLDAQDPGSGGGVFSVGVSVPYSYITQPTYFELYNVGIWRCGIGIGTQSFATLLTGGNGIWVENLAIIDGHIGVRLTERSSEVSTHLKNIVAVNNTTDWTYVHAADYTDIENCADGDNTLVYGENNLHNIVSANEFESTDDTSSDFLKLKIGSKYGNFTAVPQRGMAPLKVKFNPSVIFDKGESELAKGGTEPDIDENTEDLGGNARPGMDDAYSIGCFDMQYECVDVTV